MTFSRLFLFPFSLIYGAIMKMRNFFYNKNIFRRNQFEIPTICVGNLRVGGTGKTPHIEYLLKLLKNKYLVATLSRGYKRKTRGFRVADLFSNTSEIGDEPMQLYSKFKEVVVAVDEKRANGLRELTHRYPRLKAVLLDDAFQHRAVQAGLSILLTSYYHPYYDDYLLPAGRLREGKSGAKRADIIVVTKCPKVLSPIIRAGIKDSIKPLPYQSLYFSYIRFGGFLPLNLNYDIALKNKKFNTILLVVGIADSYTLEDHLKQFCSDLIVMKFDDHHQYSETDLQRINESWTNIYTTNKLLVTTEKDTMRLKNPLIRELVVNLPFYYIPIEVEFHQADKKQFDEQIIDYVEKNRRDTEFLKTKDRLRT